MKNTTIFGGTGFIGSALLEIIKLDKKRNVTAVGRSEKPTHPIPKEINYIQIKADNQEDLKDIVSMSDEIIDLSYSTVPQTSFDDPLFDLTSNLPFAVQLQQIASRKKIDRYLLVSSGGTVYGNSKHKKIKENHPTNPVSPYGISKLATEKYGLFFHQVYKLPILIARPSNPYGILQIGNKNQGFIGAAISAIRSGKELNIYGTTGTIRDYLHVKDLAKALYLLLEKGKIGNIYNIGSGVGSNNLEILKLIQSIEPKCAIDLKINHLPGRAFDVKRNVLDSSQILRDCNWSAQIGLETGIKEVWQKSKALLSDSSQMMAPYRHGE